MYKKNLDEEIKIGVLGQSWRTSRQRKSVSTCSSLPTSYRRTRTRERSSSSSLTHNGHNPQAR
eukprot:736680-Amphidinium_carterae.1